ncbi:MAG TPA: DUF1385 domain-containing protein [Solirubrobacteraceae bacterium]|nr:DUF1385 domain-containing protein [Solirubrobacteraceae bacterium]
MSTLERPAAQEPEGALDLTLQAKDAPVGGQAVLEGVMMRGVSTWAVAVRKPLPEDAPREQLEGEVAVESFPLTSVLKRHRVLRLPIVRGVVALGESLAIGFRALMISANAQLPPDEQEEITKGAWIGTFVVGIGLAIGLFFLLPALLTDVSGVGDDSGTLFVFVEKIIRLSVFIGYLWLISRLPDLKRLFQYHGAEHKTISCYEAGLPLTPENAQRFSRFHPRCGTSFLLIVMIVSFFVLVPIGTPEWYILYPTRILAVPIVAGLAFELIKWFGKNRRKRWAQILMWPGIQLQRLTTREPDFSQLAVAIAALEAVLAVENFENLTDEERAGLEVAA